NMPELDGLCLVEAVRDRFPLVPVVLMTAFGSEDTAVQALQRGAASYVPKKSLARDLADTLEQVLAAARTGRDRQRLLGGLTHLESSFRLENDRALVAALIAWLREVLAGMGLCDETDRVRVNIA